MIGWLWSYVLSYFPLKAKTFEDFISLLKEHGCTHVYGQAERKAKGLGANTAAVGFIGNIQYQNVFRSRTSAGRQIIFEHTSAERYGSEHGFADIEKRELTALWSMASLDVILCWIKYQIPDIKVSIVNSDGSEMDEVTIRRLRADAEKYNMKLNPVALLKGEGEVTNDEK